MDTAWSTSVEQADWIGARQPEGQWVASPPTGFPAYARLLHPMRHVDPADPDEEPVRWAHMARWSGVALEPRSQFWQIALPERLPA